jgi:stage III sporulation protein AF
MEDKQKDTIYKEYKEKIKEQITSLIKKQDLNPVSIEVEIIEDKESEDFGKISQVNVIANHKKNSTTKESNTQKITIDKIIIEDINSENDNEEKDSGASEILSVEETMLKNTLADFYNISLDNINISIQE